MTLGLPTFTVHMMIDAYPLIKILHACLALATLLLFIWRSRMSFAGMHVSRLWMRHIPDSVDTLLLGSGVVLVYISGQYPWVAAWVGIKLLAVVIYIVLGMIALHFARTLSVRRMSWLSALIVFAGIVWLAHVKQVPF